MIRRRVEYMIVCDGPRVIGSMSVCMGYATAFDSTTAAECAESAKDYGWTQVSKKLWLCKECSTKLEKGSEK